MTSVALDLTTIGHALNTILDHGIGKFGWKPRNADQRLLLQWYEDNRKEIDQLESLKALASPDYRVLNAFLKENKFEPVMKPFDGLGVVSILDMLIEWLVKCNVTTIGRFDNTGNRATYPAFEVPRGGVNIYSVDASDNPLVELQTKTGHSLWLQEAPKPESGISLAFQAQSLLTAQRTPHSEWTAGAVVPMLEMDLVTGLDWLLGFATPMDLGAAVDWEITQATQQFKLRMNEKGARVKVATSIGFELTSLKPLNYQFEQPFIGFITQPGHPDIALAAFWADTDIWRTSGESLEEL